MVFESIVVDVLNRFLGDYVENLNQSQLKLGIWGGDVVLENLKLKQNALEELNIPVQTVYGHLGKLVLKIPWKNLYGASVEASIERLFLIVNPSAEVSYDEEKEVKIALAAKQAELLRIEEAKKMEAAAGSENQLDQTFVEKLVTQIIKNVQLNISEIHIRYEDSSTNPKAPFSFGITLHNLSVHTTDENWKQTIVQDAVTKIFKILTLDGLAIYWNPCTEQYSKCKEDFIMKTLASEIATKSHLPPNYQYTLGPINASAKLKLNPKPELDTPKFSIPKVILSLHMEQLSVNLNRLQYQDMMMLADSMERMATAAPYRKYRPNLRSYRKHYKEWWRFAYRCVLEEEVRRKQRNWDWAHMLRHRNLCREYAVAYQAKLVNRGKVSGEHQSIITEAEKKLDLFNLVVIHQRIEMEVERLGKLEEEARKKRGGGGGWLSSWWYGAGSKDEELAEGTAIMEQFQNAMTPSEKEKLFRAIDYQENCAPLHLPAEYVATLSCFRLERLAVAVGDAQEVLRAAVDGVVVELGQRPSANAIKLEIQMKAFTVTGVRQGDYLPQVVISKDVSTNHNLLNVMFETNPLDGKGDQKIKVLARPLQIIYDAQTVIEIVNVFKPPSDSSALSALQSVAENKLSDLKEKSALGMQYAVNQHTFIALDIDIAASYIIVPKTGMYRGSEPCIVVKLGAISVKSVPRSDALSVSKMYKEGLPDDQIIKEIARHSYDKMALKITEIQVVIALANENWNSAIASNEPSPLHLLQPTTLVIQIHKCLITNDPRLPLIRVKGELQKIAISVSEDRLLTVCEIIVSMPLPQSEEATMLKASDSKASSLSLLKYLDPVEKEKRDTARAKRKESAEPSSVQLTDLEALFIMNELIICVNRKKDPNVESYDKFLLFSLYLLEITAVQKTYMLEAAVRLGAVSMQHHRIGKHMIQMIDTPEVTKETNDQQTCKHLFTVTYINVDKKSPDFRNIYKSVEQMIELDFTTLKMTFHLEGLQEILVVVNDYQTRMALVQRSVDRLASAGPLETIVEGEELSALKSKSGAQKSAQSKQVESIQMQVKVKVGAVEVEFANDTQRLSLVQLEGAMVGLVLKTSYTQVDCAIVNFRVQDLNPSTIHREIMTVMGGEVMNARVLMYNDPPSAPGAVDMTVEAQINCMRIVFLNWFVTSMLEFLNNFQAAQQAIIDASSQAVESARVNVQNAYENSTKLALKIRLAAPIIVVPENSRSMKALIIDLGRLTLVNKFVDIQIPDVGNMVTIDEMTMELEDMKLSNVYLSENIMHHNYERKLLRPTSFKLLVKRSLSAWCTSLPDLDVSGNMHTVAITIGHNDYRSIMNILNQNLQEGQSEVEEVKPAPSIRKEPSKATVRSCTKQNTKTSVINVSKEQEKDKPARTTMKFSFTMESFVIDLMNTYATGGQLGDMYSRDVDLARFCLRLLSVKGQLHSDDSMNTSLLLVDCTLDDTRPGRGDKMTRYLERREASNVKHQQIMTAQDKIRSMVDITYTVKNNDTFVDIRVFSFNLILAMDFMNKVMEFMSTGLGEPLAASPGDDHFEAEAKGTPPSSAGALLPESATVANVNQARSTTVDPTKNTPVTKTEVEQKKPAMMTVNVKIEEPDIILVETLDYKECDALVLNMEARFKLRQTEERMVAEGGISNLQVVIRTLGVKELTPRYLLAPTHLSLAVSQPPGSGIHADIAITSIKITFSPDIFALLNRVMATMYSSEEDDTQQVNKTVYYTDLWNIEPFKPNAFWFLKTEVAEDALTYSPINKVEPTPPPKNEICLMSSPSIILSMEMNIGRETVPVLVMQASLNGIARNWSSDFYMESTWAMQVSYYNIGRAVWEPLIEPIEVLKDSSYKYVPWELKMEIVMRQPEHLVIDSKDEGLTMESVATRQPACTVTVSSRETLEVTCTLTGMEMLTLLSNSFSAAIAEGSSTASKKLVNGDKSEYFGAPYVLHNCTGLTAKLMLVDNDDFTVHVSGDNIDPIFKEVVLETGASVPLQLKRGGLNMIQLNEAPPELKLCVKLVELEEELVVPVGRAVKRYFPLERAPRLLLQDARGLISDVAMHDAALHIYLRSVVQVKNHLSVNVNVYYMTMSGNEVRLLGEVKPGAILRLPLQAVYSPTAEIFFSVEDFTVSISPFIWRELQQEVKITKLLACESKDKTSAEKFYIRVMGTMEQVYLENTTRHTLASSCYDVELRPAVKLQNCLPVDILVSQLGLKRTQLFKPGEMVHLSHLSPHKASIVIMIQNYLDKCWVCTKNLPDSETELSVWSFESHDSPALMTLDLGVQSTELDGTQVVSLYCPFWMLNKTGMTLCYRNVDETGNVIFHPKEYKDPILFSFRAKNFFGKKNAALRIGFGEWSDKFPLDVPGSSGVVSCRLEGRTYQVAVTNQLSFNSLTKMVVFTPFYLIINEASFIIQYQEYNRSGDPWIEVEGNSSAPLWPSAPAAPSAQGEERLLLLRALGTRAASAPFSYTDHRSTCLKLDNEYGGLHVEVQCTEGGTYITVRQYHPGHAPALLVNCGPCHVAVQELAHSQATKIPPMHKMLYTWEDPAGSRSLLFKGRDKEAVANDLRQDGFGEYMIDETHRVYWVSFLDGLQRVILFTDSALLAKGAHNVGDAELVDTEYVLSIQGMGLSLVNDPHHQEILYISISNSGIIWEQSKMGSRRYKKIEGTKHVQFEEAYQKWLNDRSVSKEEPVSPRYHIDNKIEVDFEEMRILKPSPRLVRRTLEPGLWASYGVTAHSTRLHARLHRLQADQQLPLPTFPVALAPVPPPRTIATQDISGLKPFIEVSIVERKMEHSKVRQYKYFKVLIQEFHIKLDMRLLNALMGMFPQRVLDEREALEAFQIDLEKATQPLEAEAAMGVATDTKNFYDLLHLSPLKVHVSFSLGGATQLPTFVGTLLQSIGVTLTDMNDVVFKLSYYERNYEFLSQKELIAQAQSHYTGQALKQLYVLVLGLDVIGNPYGLVIGLKKGVEDLFYEPFQGAIQGPGEFAEGLFLGVRSLVGHTVGGAAGAMSRITGAMGHGLAALSLDKDYQRRRRDNMNKPPANLQEGLARSGKGLVMGVVDGVTGVFSAPLEGAREEGVGGFFKGLGRGAVGLVARPTTGVVDFASGSFSAVKRAADLSEEVTKLRAPRYLPADTGVRPYSRRHAEGYKLLSELEKGKFVTTDSYEAHVWIIAGKEAVMCTDKRLLYLEKNNVFGGWQVVWGYLWTEIPEIPTPVSKGVYIPIPKKKVLGVFPSTGSGKVIFLYDDALKKFLIAVCERLMRAN